MSGRYTSDADLAAELGITVEDVRNGCRHKGWPHLRPKRSVWKFTPEQVAQIEALIAVTPKPKAASSGSGRTSRSKARAS